VLYSNPGQDITNPHGFPFFFQSFPENFWIPDKLGHNRFLSNPFQFILPLDAMQSEILKLTHKKARAADKL
jgi:hypothetical protein